MSVFGAMTTAVGGLNAQSRALSHMSDNIANANTNGFKRVDTNFDSLVTNSSKRFHSSGSVVASPKYMNRIQGDVISSAIATNMAISGSGYFVVSQATAGVTPADVTINDLQLYTRRGDFGLDRNYYMVNGAGYHLRGRVIDSSVTPPTPVGSPVPVQVNVLSKPANPTSEIIFNGNLPGQRVAVPDQLGLRGGGDTPADPLLATIPTAAVPTFIANSVLAGSLTGYDNAGAQVDLQLRWARETDVAPSIWRLYYYNGEPATPEWNQVPGIGNLEFDATGTMTTPATGITATDAVMTVFDPNLNRTHELNAGITIDFRFNRQGVSQLTMYDASDFTLQRLEQDGYARGVLTGVAVDDRGFVVAEYDNGLSDPIYQVILATFANEDQLRRRDGEAFEVTPESGNPQLHPMNEAGAGQIVSSSLERSNVDIADEFTKMIVAQRTYSANSRVITTADEMLQEVINLKR